MQTATVAGTPATDYLEEGGFDEEAKLLKRLDAAPAMWGIRTRQGVLLPLASRTKSGAISKYVGTFGKAEPAWSERQRVWKIYRERYGCRAVRIRLTEAD